MNTLDGIVFGILFILLNGLFVAIEFALARVSKTRIENLAKSNKNRTASLILIALDNIDSYISACQVGITISSLALGAIGEMTISSLLRPLIQTFLPTSSSEFTVHSIALPIALLIVTYFHVVIGEIIPKTVAFINPETTAKSLIWFLEGFKFIVGPLVSILNFSASSILRLFGIKDLRTTFVYTEDELKMLLNVSQEEGVLEQSEKEMITNIFDFPDTVTREIMTPRIDMFCIESNKVIEEAAKISIESKHSRLPVYENSIDNIIGVITTRDLLEEVDNGNYKKQVAEIAKPVIKVPESKSINDLLTQMKKESIQLAIVIDEFGGTSGLVTIEDIVEEIVGEIHDEYDDEKVESFQIISENNILIDGKTNIDEINERFGTDFPTEHYDTIGGLTFGLLGKEPALGDKVESNGFILKVEKKDKNKQRIKQVRLIKPAKTNGKVSENGKEKTEKKLEKADTVKD